MKRLVLLWLWLSLMFVAPISSFAISGNYSDPGGGTYWCNIYVAEVSHGKSYQWCTGIDETTGMNNFRGFETDNGGELSIGSPTVLVRFRYHYGQPKGFDRNGSDQSFYVMTRSGSLHKIGEWPKGGNFTQTDYTYGVIGNGSMDGTWLSFRYAPNQAGLENVTGIQIENDTYYKQDHFWAWDTDYSFTIHMRYLKDLEMEFEKCKDAQVEWIAPNKVKVSADNTWLPEYTHTCTYRSSYMAKVVTDDGTVYSDGSIFVEDRQAKSIELDVPAQNFNVEVTKVGIFYYVYNNTTLELRLPKATKAETHFNNASSDVTATFNQVKGEMRLQWVMDNAVAEEGDFQIYRTLMSEYGSYTGNREKVGSTSDNYFIDKEMYGLDYNKYYRYEVFQLKNSWAPLEIPSDPQPLANINAAIVMTNTVPVIPLHLSQDVDVTDNIKIDWDFGNVPKNETSITFYVNRIDPDGTIRKKYGEVTVPRDAGKASFTDDKPESSCEVYRYFVNTDMLDGKLHFTSDTIQSSLLDGSIVTGVTISKGNYQGSVHVNWTAKQVGTSPTYYEVHRRFIGASDWLTIGTTSGTTTNYTYVDQTAEPGRFYEYRVAAYSADCDGTGRVISNAIVESGFSQAAGVIAGRVQFDTGTAVEGVRLNLMRSGDETSRPQFYSRKLLDDGVGMVWLAEPSTANNLLRLDRPFTLQMWINPDEEQHWVGLFKMDKYDGDTYDSEGNLKGYNFGLFNYNHNQYGGDHDGFALMLKFGGTEKWFQNPATGAYGVIEYNKYSHITIRNNADGSITFIINGDVENPYIFDIKDYPSLHFDTSEIPADYDNKVKVRICGAYGGNHHNTLKGNIDEVRIWNRALPDNEIVTTYDRLLSGRETGLKLYWPFDEGLEEYAFDYSYTDGIPNGNHPDLGNNNRPSEIVPSEDQLSLYGLTNTNGEYIIRGIPFTGSGTGYTVAPTKGIHSFNPASRTGFISANSLSLNGYDFTDVSSFKVRGAIRYSGTTIPVDSVTFYVDGMPCNKNDKLIYSDANGEYEISVPIGSHYIEARRDGHTFEGAGRYPVEEDATYEFVDDTHIDFYDNTLAVFAGRVTGGNTEGEKPLGYGVSENTIGKAIITLTPLDHPQRMLNAVQQVQGTTIEWVPNPENVAVESSSLDISSTSYRAGGDVDDVKNIVITTDEETGEFSAKIPPIRYMVRSVRFPNNPTIENDEVFLSLPAVNLTNPKDSITPDTVYTVSNEPLPLFRCNKKMMLTYHSSPVIDITQMGMPPGAFGTDTLTVTDMGEEIKLPIYNYNESTGEVTYNYGYPIFQLGRTYDFKIMAYEPYMNYDKIAAGKLRKDMLRDSVITFGNELGEAALIAAEDNVIDGHELKRGDMAKLDPEQVRLDSVGVGHYKWRAGIPALTAPFTRNMNASMVIQGKTKLWSYEGLNGIIAGVVPTGNNFITAGPSHVQMVLRDPPGDASYATWARDSVTSDYTYTVRGVHNNTEFGVDIRNSVEYDMIAGSAFFGTVFYNNIVSENQVSWKYDVHKTWDNHKSVTYTNGMAISSNSTMDYVGRDGDVFIGYSTNYIIGAADKVGIFKQEDGSWAVDMQETMAMDEKFNTHFEYSQNYIETTLFSNIKRTRNTMLKHINSMSEIEEDPQVSTYYTFLTEDDPRYGSSNSDKEVWGDQAADGMEGPSYYARFPKGFEGCDSVHWCNQVIESWKKTLADNEEDKIKAFNNPNCKIGNESFERGVTVSNTTGTTTNTVDNSVENFSTGLAYRGKNGYLINKSGCIIISNTDIGYHQTKYDIDETTIVERFGYTLNDTQRGNAHTVDIFKSPKGWSTIFRTRGGQTRCPYEGETRTKYYNPGILLDYATMKSDNPHISMPIRNFVDIPAGQEAQVQVVFTNESETHEALTSAIVYVDAQTNPNGLQIYMDGEPLVNGVEMWLEYGVPITKTLTIKQSDNSVLDYNDITLFLANSCKPERWIYETVSFSAHFVPAAPPVTLNLNKTILNQRAVQNKEEIVATISDINRLFSGLKGVRLKYRFAGDSQWITAHEWLTDESYLSEGHETDVQSLMPNDKPNITYDLKLPNIDGHYMVAAESMCILAGKDYTAMTDEIEVIRDTRGPKLLGQAYPNTGILTPTDDIRIKFNEDIRESYLTKDDNFFITGSLNDSQVSHDVSLQFNGTPVETDAYLPIANTSFASSLWLKRKSGGTIIEHGTEGNSLSVKLDDQGYVTVDMVGETIRSEYAVPADKWVFLAMNYVKGSIGTQNTLTMLMATDSEEKMLFDEAIVPDYNANGRLALGRGFTGMMHELVLWNKNCPVRTLLASKDEVVAPYLPGLVGYWKMNEGHGTIVTDYARSRNIHLSAESWNVENTNLAAHLDGTGSIKIPMGTISPRSTDSYVVETWFRGEKDKNARATLLSVTDRVSIGFDYDNSMILHLYNDTLSSLTGNGLPIVVSNVNYNDGNWHHLALNVHRGVSAVVYIDGKAVKTLAEQQLPAPAGDFLYVGSILKSNPENPQFLEESYHFTGDIDELRVWNVACDGTSVIANRYNQVDTAEVAGLIAYFPMERSVLDANGNIITEFSLDNKAPLSISYGVAAAIGEGVTQAVTAPALRTAPLRQNLDFDFTASSDEIYINLNTLPSRMQGNLLTFIVKNVRDLQDNLSETVTWSAVVDYNTLEWDQESLDIEKDRLSEVSVFASLRNKGRESGRFNISGLPTWIVPSVTTGVLGTNESATIEFTVGADAPVGSHSVYAYAVNDDDICSPLLLNIHVSGNDPQWTVNPDGYESSMNIIGQIYFGDKICTNTNTKLAAFVGDECRGLASPKLVTSRDAYFVNMTIYGLEDVTVLQPISFRIYDAEQGVVLSDVITTLNGTTLDISYRPNDLLGDYDNPVKWTASEQIEQLCNLKNGWNWISLYVQPDEDKADLESVFGHAKVFNTIKGKEGFAMNSGSKWTAEGLDTVAVGTLYKIKMTKDVNYNIVGHRINTQETFQTIYPGWNWIGPLSIYNLSLGEAFADLSPMRGDIVKSKNQVAFYDGYKWEGDLGALIPGMGYYYKSNNPDTVIFRYPTIDESYNFAPVMRAARASSNSPFEPVDHHQFSDNMNVVAHLMVDGVRVDTLFIGAFIDDECRGVTTATEDGYYLLTIAGNAEEMGKNVKFATMIDGQIVNINEQLPWVSDIIYGDLDEPVLLTVGSSAVDDIQALGSNITVTPTLVQDAVQVRSDALLGSVTVYSVGGSIVVRLSQINENAVTISLDHVSPGVYFVEAITNDGYRVVKQIIKQ